MFHGYRQGTGLSTYGNLPLGTSSDIKTCPRTDDWGRWCLCGWRASLRNAGSCRPGLSRVESRYYQYPGGFAEWLAKYVFGIRSSRTPSQWCLRLCSPSVLSILIRKTSILCFQGFPATYPEKATCWPRWGTTGVGGGAVRTPYPQSNMPRRNLPGTTLCPNCTTSNFRCIFLSTVSFYFRKTSMHFKKGMPM